MQGLLLPSCAIVFSTLLCIVFFSKKRINNLETKIYAIILWSVLADSIFACLLQVFAYLENFNDFNLLLINIINRLDFIAVITYSTCLYLYTIVITKNPRLDQFKRLKYMLVIADTIIIVSTLFFDIKIISDGSNYSITGNAAIATFSICCFYILLSVVTTLININHVDKRSIPVLMSSLIIIFLLISFLINPYLIIISITLTFINYIMFYTIENPDMMMIEQLNAARDQAERANNAKSDFLSSMSHEIRTPLNAILGFSQALEEENLPYQAKEEVKDIVMASETLLEIVNGILDISKIEANKLEIVNTEYNFNKLLEELVSLTKAKIGEKPLEFKYSFSPDLPKYLYGDKVRVKQVILNLLTNAVKYTKKGWIDFRVNCVKKKDYCRLLISVQDTGIGIKPDSINKLFNKFERLDIEKNNTIEGTGLGLAITKKLLELMGGKIVVQSIYGEGSKFTVAIDQRIIDSPTNPYLEKTQELKIQDLNLVNRRILIVDDNIINLKVATRLLSDYHCIIDTLTSGVDCVDKISVGASYDLILMDDMMPKMSGTETLHKLQGIEDFNTPVVALTANAISGMREKYLSEGFSEYLSKPIDKVELNQVLNKFLR